nr:LOW QUALITY PROTEIN: neurobeachin-like protein 1 [Rhipicephalus microplus]
MSAKEALEALWSAYQIKRNSTTLLEYMVEFRRQYGDCLKTDFPANPSRSVASPHLIDLPEGFLQVVELYLRECSDECNTGVTVETVQKASVAVQVLSILSRNFNNIPFVSTSNAVPLIIVISSAVANQYTQHTKDANDHNTASFLLSVLVFLEVLYDPHLTWQKMCAKVPLDSTKGKVSPSHLHLEVIPFFYDCLSSKPCFLPASIQMKLIHVFGAIICGAQHNAQVAINQNTVEILFHRLREQECPLEVKMTAVRCILQGIVTLCASPPEKRKVDLNAFVREYLGTLSKLMTEEEKPTQVDTAHWMMSGLQELFSLNSNLALKKVFHDNEMVERLIRSLHGTKLKSGSAQKMATSSVRLIHVFLSSFPFAKKHFSNMQGYRTLISTLKTMGEPQQSTLETLLEWLVEETPRLTRTSSTLRNLELMIHLLHWLPQLESHSLQLWLAEQLDSMVKGSLRSRMACARGGVIPAIIHVLGRSNTIGGKAVGQLLKFLVTLASCSISTSELKALFHLLRPSTSGEQHQYTLPLMYALSSMVKSDGWLGASHFFDFSDPDEGIVIPNIKKWPGSGFAFHAWVRLEKLNARKEGAFRRQFYSFTTPNGTLESFFTAQGKLVVAVATKKEYYAVPVEGVTLDDETWHSVDICHTAARRPFTNSTTVVFIDGRQRVSVQVKLPSISEFSQCHVACGNQASASTGERRSADGRGSGDSSGSTSSVEHGSGAGEEQLSQNTATGGFLRNSTLGSFLSGWDTDKIFSMAPSVPANLRSAFNVDPDPSISVSPLESHEQVWGLSRGLKGQIGSLCLFSEPLQASQVKMMYTGGPRNYTLFKNEDSVEVAELLGKLVLYYDAKASVDGTCTNLAPSSSIYDGTFTGRYCHTQNVKDTVNLIGGFPTLYVLLENSGKPIPKCSPSFEAASTPSSNKASEEIVDDWIVVPSSSSSFSGPQSVLLDLLCETEGDPKTLAKDLRLAQNQVSSFLVIVQHLMQGSPENQMQLLARTGIPTIGALMQRVPGHCIDVNVLMAVQLLVENASGVENAQEMLQLVYQHILFDFRIWSKGSFAVRLGHIQYLTTIIKEDRKYFRKKYGPRFMLDMVQMFYSDCSLLTSDDVKTIRMAVLSLVKFYMMRDVSIQDVNAVVSYMLSQRKEELAKEMIEILLHLLESPSTKDQLVLLLYEPNCAELFYCILLNREFSSCTKVKVLKVIQALLRSDRVYEKSKSRLRLAEVGFSSLTGLLSPNEVTSEVARELVNLILMSDISQAFPGFLAVLNLIKNMDIELKFYAAKKLLAVLTDSAVLLPQLAAQAGWQECVLSLLIKEPISESNCANRATMPTLDLIDLNSLEADTSADSEKPGSPVLKRGTLHRLSQKALVAQQSLEEILPGSPKASQIFTHLKEHIFDFEISQLLGSARSRTNSQCSSQEDLASDATQQSSPVSVTPSSLRKAPDQSPRISPVHKMLGTSPVRSPVDNGLSGGTEEQLIDCVVESAFLLAWRGIEGSSKQCWMERGQVLVCVNKLALTNELVASHLEIKRKLFERLLQACCTSLQESGQANATYAENASELMKLVFDFVCHENVEDESRLSEKVRRTVELAYVIKPLYWKLSQQENFARMRLKLTLNHNFDSHYQASCLRDNQGILTNQNTSCLPPITAEAKAMQQKEDIVAEEDIQALQGQVQDLENPDGIIDKKKPVIEEDCELVTLMKVVKGRFEVTATQIYFIDLSPVREEGERHDFTYPLHMLREVHLRRYNLRRSALEFFLVDQTNFFLNFTTKIRNKIFGRVVALHPPNLLYSSGTRSPAELLRASGLTQRWVNREISNFEYLMHLNTIAGRTYNDLSQYPVFPWVLADYTSPKLELDSPSVYRDLSRPIGIVNPKNIEEVKAKYDSFVDITGTVEKFHFGTHYSNSAGVLHYLVRLEPFTSLHIELQSGRFDVADRQFHSVEGTWKMLMESPNDVKELIPEFFYLPEFLTNMNAFDLGRLQGTKEQVDDVRLPAWATSPEDFIYKHRKALESEYVSLHLHDWIDLIFGYKQKGSAAVEALNVFYYVSYEGAVDLDAIKDPVQREATEGIINNFGQTPCQLLKEPHPRRLSYEGAMLRMTKSDTKPPNLFLFLQNLKAYVVDAPLSCPIVHVNIPRSPARSFMQHGLMDTLVTVGCDGSLGVHGWLPYDRTRSYPNYFTFERDPNIQNPKSAKKLAGVFQPGAKVHSRLFVLSSDGKFLVSGGHWDNSVRAYSLLRSKQVAHVILHKDVVTSLATDTCGMYLMTGSRDTTCIIWELNQLGSGSFLPNKPFQILCGHDSEVTCVAVITELDMALSGSKDGTVNVHSVREGHFLHTLRLPGDMPEQVTLLSVSHLGFICVHSCPDPQALLKSGYVLHLYTINGKYLLRKEVARAISDMIICDDYLITGDEEGLLVIYELFGLAEKVSLPLCFPILTVARTPTNSHLICSLSDGKLVVIGITTSSLRSFS